MIPVLESDGFIKWFLENKSNSFYFQSTMKSKIEEILKGKDSVYKEKTLIYYQY